MIEQICQKAKAAAFEMGKLSADAKNNALCRMANALEANAEKILAANKLDVAAAKARGLKASLLDRLALDQKKIQTMAKELREVSALPDPIGTYLGTWTRPNGLIISQIRVPMGVVGVIYESRPNVTSDSAGICIKGVLAYSTVSQIGFMMAGLGAAATAAGGLTEGWFASLYHMVSHAFFEGLGFLIAGGIIHAIGTRDMRLMGGLRKMMPWSFGLMAIMIITTSGLPPFAAFFSKGLILTSVTEIGTYAGLIQTVILYATTAITFAYCVRMFSLVFMAPETEHIKKQHVHESAKVMMIPATILAVFCIVWGVAEPLVANFMHVELAAGTGLAVLGEAFLNLETPIFLSLLIPTGLIAYYSYYKGFQGVRNIASGKNPLSALLNHAYFFDDFYNLIGRGINGFSAALTRMENALFARWPDSGASKVAEAAQPGHVTTLKKGPSDSFRNYVAAAVLGFILILVVIVLTGVI